MRSEDVGYVESLAGDVPDPLGVFVNRTLNLRSVKAIGYDMDYTLIHYHVDRWEREAFGHARDIMVERGLPVADFTFDPTRFIQGLVIDLALGNIVKATRFGYVISASHGTRRLGYDEVRRCYAGQSVDLSEGRYRFLNTMFSMSEASLYAQLVDAFDRGELAPSIGPMGYDELFMQVASAVDQTHTTARLKERIVADPARYVDPDPEVVKTLIDQRLAGKRVFLVTNSDWAYTDPMMRFVFGDSAPGGDWQQIFDFIVCGAAKPNFFQNRQPAWLLVDPSQGLFTPHAGPLQTGHVYHGADATTVETSLGVGGDEILYVGDHLFGDVHVSKSALRWRTALIIRELESEITAAAAFAPQETALVELMRRKGAIEAELSQLRMDRTREAAGDARTVRAGRAGRTDLDAEIQRRRTEINQLDDEIGPLAASAAELGNPHWGPLMRTGNDKSLYARQVERYADIYTSRVSNLRPRTPFAYFRAARTSLPHDR